MTEVVVLCWIQFYCILKEAAFVATAILLPFAILFTWFAISFYRNLAVHTYETRKNGIKELEELKQVIADRKYDITMKPWDSTERVYIVILNMQYFIFMDNTM